MNSLSSLRFSLVAVVLASASAACSSDADPAKPEPTPDAGKHDPAPDSGEPTEFPRAYVGEVEGTDARVGIFAKDPETFRLYFCGGPETVGSLTHWFNTTVNPTGGFDYSIQIEKDRAEGTYTSPEGEHAFTARPVTWGTIPGLYEATGPCGKVGVVISPVPESEEFHVQGACLGDVLIDAKQVNPILPLTLGSDGSIEVQVDGETDTLLVKPAIM